jgi:predicted nucleic acid-binding protein
MRAASRKVFRFCGSSRWFLAKVQVNIKCKGTVGVLLQALRRKLLTLTDFELLIHEIKRQPALWISEQLCDEALATAQRESGS